MTARILPLLSASGSAPLAIAPKRDAVPPELRALRGWLLWKFEQRAGEPKPRKVPHYIDGSRRRGVQGAPEDRRLLASFDDALAAARPGFGLGLAMLPDWGLVALDFDHVVDARGTVRADVEALVAATYAETSPSGRGVRAFVRGAADDAKSRDEPYGFETFHAKGFVTVTGNALPGADLVGVAPITSALRSLISRRFGERHADPAPPRSRNEHDPLMIEPPCGLTSVEIRETLDALDPAALSYDEWVDTLMALHHETSGSDEGLELIDTWSQRDAERYVDVEDIAKRWRGFDGAKGRVVTMRTVQRLARTTTKARSASIVAPTDRPRFQRLTRREFAQRPRRGYHIKGVLPRAELVVVYGESGAGKSFVVLDMALAIARGVPWRGLRVRQGQVVYVVAEGLGGFGGRIDAYEHHQSVEVPDTFTIIEDPPNLLANDHEALVAQLQATGGADLIILDTFAQVTPGANENAADDVGKALRHCKAIHRDTGATVLLVHHAGKDLTKGARGWSGLKAAADAELSVEKAGGLTGRVEITKMKDGRADVAIGFRLEVVPVGVDDDGDVVDSCVVEYLEQAPQRKRRKLGTNQAAVFEAAMDLMGDRDSAPVALVLTAAVERIAPKPGKRDRRHEYASAALGELEKSNTLRVVDGQLSLVS